MPVVGEQLVDDQLHRVHARSAGRPRRSTSSAVGLVVDVAVGHRPPLIELVEHDRAEQPAVVRLGLQRAAAGRASAARPPARRAAGRRRPERRVEGERVEAALEAHQQADQAAGHLGDDREAVGVRPRRAGAARRATGRARWSGWLRLTLTVRPVRRASSRHPRPLAGRHVERGRARTGTRRARRGAARRRSRTARRPPRSCPARARRTSTGGSVCATVEKPSAPARSASFDDRRPSPRCRRRWPVRWPRPARPSRRPRTRAVGDLRADVDRVLPCVEGVEVLRERLPLPRDPLGQRVPGMSSTPSISSISHSWRSGPPGRSRRRSCPSPPWSRRATTTG